MVDQNPDVAKQVHDEGHEVASHCILHPQLNTLSTDELQSEINKNQQKLFSRLQASCLAISVPLWRY